MWCEKVTQLGQERGGRALVGVNRRDEGWGIRWHTCKEELPVRTVAETLVHMQRGWLCGYQHKVNLYSFLSLALRTEAVDK
jgi:hypothetical protein